jgi:sugar fermentation stimulation protein A
MTDIFRPFGRILRARFKDRPNRFLVRCEHGGKLLSAFLPNPGRLRELLLPGSRLYVVEEEARPDRSTRFTVVGVDREGCPIMLDTHRTNGAARHLLEERLIPGLEDVSVVRQEVAVGRSRFDFLLRDGRGEMLLEVKSCTLFGRRVAMFPDAVTARGARHLEELAAHAAAGSRTAVLFIAHWPNARTFMPDFHTDLHFARTFLSARGSVDLIPIAVRWQHDLSLSDRVRLLAIPWSLIETEAHDRGSYILVLKLRERCWLPMGRTGNAFFPQGFYLYVGSAMANLSARMARHVRTRKRFHWHIDWLRSAAEVHAVLAVRSSTRLECAIAAGLGPISAWSIPGFGCSDCFCASHLFGMADDPLQSPAFHRLLQYFRMDRYTDGDFPSQGALAGNRGPSTLPDPHR